MIRWWNENEVRHSADLLAVGLAVGTKPRESSVRILKGRESAEPMIELLFAPTKNPETQPMGTPDAPVRGNPDMLPVPPWVRDRTPMPTQPTPTVE